ncbi:MAG: PhzF family phenazine biosynthesis protein, partial [Methanoregulaceae archaeon]
MTAELHLTDAFTGTPFRGNPAGVCILDEEADPAWMLSVAGEVRASETAFLFPGKNEWNLRWFTPVTEVDLCGHATLAAAGVLWSSGRELPGSAISFRTRSGLLTARKEGDCISLDFPAEPVSPIPCPPGLCEAIGSVPVFTAANRMDLLAEVSSETLVRNLVPDPDTLAKLPYRGILVTARSGSKDYDFVSRFFAPAVGIPEDPVTGSAHCALAPYWAGKLGKTS